MGRVLVEWVTYVAGGSVDRNTWVAGALSRHARHGLPLTIPTELICAAEAAKEKFIIRLGEDLRDAIQGRAEELGIDVSTWVRLAICASIAPHL